MTMVKAAAKMGFHLPPHADKKYPPRPMTSALHVALKLCTAVSLVGALGLTYSSLSKQSAAFLAMTAAGLASSATLIWTRLRSEGVASFLPESMHPFLFELTPVELAMGLAHSMDWEAMANAAIEVAPLLLVRSKSEAQQAIANMSSPMRDFFEGKGIVSLLPWDVQRILLPPALHEHRRMKYGVDAKPPVQPANLEAQIALSKSLVEARMGDAVNAIEAQSTGARVLVTIARQAAWLRAQIRASSWAEIQVYLLVIVLLAMGSRALAKVAFAFARYGLAEVIRLLE